MTINQINQKADELSFTSSGSFVLDQPERFYPLLGIDFDEVDAPTPIFDFLIENLGVAFDSDIRLDWFDSKKEALEFMGLLNLATDGIIRGVLLWDEAASLPVCASVRSI